MYKTYWWLVRGPVLLLFPSFFYDIEVLFLLISFLVNHLSIGLKTIFSDYLHNKLSKTFLIILIRLASFEFLRYILELLV